jgi:hypothetical protein
VLERFRETPDGALHAAPDDAQSSPLNQGTREALLAFLRLL